MAMKVFPVAIKRSKKEDSHIESISKGRVMISISLILRNIVTIIAVIRFNSCNLLNI